MQKTELYQFNLIEGGDPFSQEPINENTQSMETLLQQISATGARLSVGTYVGSGAWGPNNPTTLTFDFAPKAVFIQRYNSFLAGDGYAAALLIRPCDTIVTGSSSNARGEVTWGDNSVSWYVSDSSSAQLSSQYSYHYFALG